MFIVKYSFNLESKCKRDLVVLKVKRILRIRLKYKSLNFLILIYLNYSNIVSKFGFVVEDIRRPNNQDFAHFYYLYTIYKIVVGSPVLISFLFKFL